MKAGTMNGLIGANMNVKLAETPMRVYSEAEAKGDTGAMERAMGYAEEFSQKAKECSDEAKEAMKSEVKEEKKEQEALIERRREEAAARRGETSGRLPEPVDTAEISEEGKKASQGAAAPAGTGAGGPAAADIAKTYTESGSAVDMQAAEPQICVKA